jgi:hypothetical protein
MRRGKADRWERLVRKGFSKGLHPSQEWVYANDAIDLLRREHQAVVRMVKAYKELCRPHDSDRCVEYLEAWHHIENTCDAILARLKARAQ